jgi:hypothetical protein
MVVPSTATSLTRMEDANHSETIFRNVLEYSINFDSRYIWIKKVSKRKKKPKLDWVGGLKEYRDQYTALELEKKR